MNKVAQFVIFETAFGCCGLVFGRERDKISRVCLPAPKAVIRREIVEFSADAVKGTSVSIQRMITSIQSYFHGERVVFTTDALDMSSRGEFQRRVLAMESTIPYGKAASYGWIGRQLRKRKGVQAIGQALSTNPFPIIVPCHRAVKSTRELGGFQRRGDMKRRMLALEGVRFDSSGRVVPEDFLG